MELEEQLALKDVNISVVRGAREWLAEKGFDPKMGARPMKRVIQEQIKRPLADDLLFGKLADGGDVVVEAPAGEANELKLKVKARKKAKKAKKQVSPASSD
jgi:ATP-dependent Clp protease ATP-binding subunit ClpA